MSDKPDLEFVPFQKISRYNRHIVVTEKIDGTNACVYISEDGESVYAASRSRWITPEDDNYGFAGWVQRHKPELLSLGPGHHFGEWWGQGIQRKYGLLEKRFSLFNTARWGNDNPPPSCCSVVPVLATGLASEVNVIDVFNGLKLLGSVAAPGFMNPEGIVVYHTAGRNLFKMTFDGNDEHKGI